MARSAFLKKIEPMNTEVEYLPQDQFVDNASTRSDQANFYNPDIRRMENLAQEQALIDVSGGMMGVGTKLMAGRLASAARPALRVNPEMAHLVDISPRLARREAYKLGNINRMKKTATKGNVAAASAFMAPDLLQMFSQ